MSTWDIIILDKSASMLNNIKNLISGYNNLVEEQINQGSNNKFTCITFNTTVDIFVEGTFPNIDKIEDGDIITSGCTALLDAIGEAYTLVLNSSHKKVSLTIITDGLENSSKKYTRQDLDSLKNEINKNTDLNVTFIGSDINCIALNPISRHVSTNINYNGDLSSAMRSMSQSISSQRENQEFVNEDIVSNEQMKNASVQISINKPLIPPPKRSKSFSHPHPKKFKLECDNCIIE